MSARKVGSPRVACVGEWPFFPHKQGLHVRNFKMHKWGTRTDVANCMNNILFINEKNGTIPEVITVPYYLICTYVFFG